MTAEVIDIRSAPRREMPYHLAAEASILGAVIWRNEVLDQLVDLEVDDFYDMRHRVVWTAMRNLAAADKPIDVVTLENEVEKAGKLDALGGVAFIGLLIANVPTPDNVIAYRDTVVLAAQNRRVALEISSALERVRTWAHDPRELLAETIGSLERIETDGRLGSTGVAKGVYGSPFKAWLGDTEPGNDPADIFDAHGIIVRAEPCVILGDPKVGKTLIVEDLAIHLAAGRKTWCDVPLYRRCRVLALLREDSELTTRRRFFQMARGANIDHYELDGWLEVDGVTPLYFDDPKHVAQLGRQLKNYDVVLIDSLSTIHNGDENSVESMAPIMNQWRDLSLTTKTAIVIIHHFRKRANGDKGGSDHGVGGVLQRARGSSIIGATTRHAVGISAGPEKGQIVVDVESNHDVDVEPFVITRLAGTTNRGQRFLTHKRVGSLRDARTVTDANVIDPITLKVVRDAGMEGVGSRDLRTYVIEQMKMTHGGGCRPARVDISARRLEGLGSIELLKTARKWRSIQ